MDLAPAPCFSPTLYPIQPNVYRKLTNSMINRTNCPSRRAKRYRNSAGLPGKSQKGVPSQPSLPFFCRARNPRFQRMTDEPRRSSADGLPPALLRVESTDGERPLCAPKSPICKAKTPIYPPLLANLPRPYRKVVATLPSPRLYSDDRIYERNSSPNHPQKRKVRKERIDKQIAPLKACFEPTHDSRTGGE